jgi:hypothetical protein
MNKLLLLSTFFLSVSVFSAQNIPLDQQIASFSVEEVSDAELNARGLGIVRDIGGETKGTSGGKPEVEPTPPATVEDRLSRTGTIIQAAKDIVALGEAIYELVKKGKPTNVTEYAPISVVPRDPITKEYVDPFDLEGFSIPVEKNFVAYAKNLAGATVVTFSYKVIFSYGGSYNGNGKYLTNVLIVPGKVETKFGWDFNATMKLSGIMNHGTKAQPVAGIMVTVKYQMNSWSTALERNDTIHITGNGDLKNHNM